MYIIPYYFEPCTEESERERKEKCYIRLFLEEVSLPGRQDGVATFPYTIIPYIPYIPIFPRSFPSSAAAAIFFASHLDK